MRTKEICRLAHLEQAVGDLGGRHVAKLVVPYPVRLVSGISREDEMRPTIERLSTIERRQRRCEGREQRTGTHVMSLRHFEKRLGVGEEMRRLRQLVPSRFLDFDVRVRGW
jgi:hypothetical protein